MHDTNTQGDEEGYIRRLRAKAKQKPQAGWLTVSDRACHHHPIPVMSEHINFNEHKVQNAVFI